MLHFVRQSLVSSKARTPPRVSSTVIILAYGRQQLGAERSLTRSINRDNRQPEVGSCSSKLNGLDLLPYRTTYVLGRRLSIDISFSLVPGIDIHRMRVLGISLHLSSIHSSPAPSSPSPPPSSPSPPPFPPPSAAPILPQPSANSPRVRLTARNPATVPQNPTIPRFSRSTILLSRNVAAVGTP